MGFTHTGVRRGEEVNSDYYWSCSFESLLVACSRSLGSSAGSTDEAAVEAGDCGFSKESKRHLDSSFFFS